MLHKLDLEGGAPEGTRTRLGLGMAALGRPAYITLGHDRDFPGGRTREAMRAQAHAVLDAARAQGIRYVDAARSYGDAEAFVRAWLDARGLAPGSVTVGSKWGYVYEGAWRLVAERHERKDHSLAALERQIAESRALLGDHLALYQVHSATAESGVLDDAAVLDELARLRDAGLPVGVTTSGPAQADTVRRAIAIVRGGAPLFSSVQTTWNLLERAGEEALREAHDAGRVVLVKEVLANGRLTGRGDAGAAAAAAAGAAGALAATADAHGVTADAVAIAAALAQPWADMVLLGASTVEQLASNVKARAIRLSSEDLAQLGTMRVSAEEYWRDRSRLPWT
jgi:aryl-alcohol dehydrogenase-like predicted oxidoreductase